ncbi:MAG: M28 family peptidase [Planctomycetaceae bacterium]
MTSPTKSDSLVLRAMGPDSSNMDVDIERIRSHIVRLTQSPRPAQSDELEQARRYVTDGLEKAGWLVQRAPFSAVADDGITRLQGVNLVARHALHAAGGPRLCVGAHLDSRPDTVGADDNASAVAALLEIARLLPAKWPASAKLDLELVAFDLEENGMLGGAFHAGRLKAEGVDLRAMVSLEMLGYCDRAPGSQALPRSLVGKYPDTGNFIAVIGNQNSGDLIGAMCAGMQTVAGLPVETLAVESNGEYLQATRLSDHSPFWDAGYAAVMITDTSFLRNPYYHTPGDTMETLDMPFLHRVAEGCFQAVRHIVANGL